MLCGIACDAIGLLLLSIAVEEWVPFALLPLFALGGVAVPALQAMMSRGISDERQGELQGLLSSFNSLGAIIGPVLVTSLYFYDSGISSWNGMGISCNTLCNHPTLIA